MTASIAVFSPNLARRRRLGRIFKWFCLAMTLGALSMLAVLLVQVFAQAWSHLSVKLLTNFPSMLAPENAGIKGALFGSIWLIAITAVVSVPLGVGAAIYLTEYAGDNRFTRFIGLNIANLAGVPSIVYGILGLAVFVRWCTMGRSVLAGGLTMSLLVLPVIIIACQEAIKAVPQSIRSAAYALGATRWQTIWHHVLPSALPGIMTGVILALSRAVGEAAPLIMIGALTYVAFVPSGPLDPFSAMPIQIFNWTADPNKEFHQLAAAAIVVLLAMLVLMNGAAVAIRTWQQRRKAW